MKTKTKRLFIKAVWSLNWFNWQNFVFIGFNQDDIVGRSGEQTGVVHRECSTAWHHRFGLSATRPADFKPENVSHPVRRFELIRFSLVN